MPNPSKVLIIQTAFIGDAILASALVESIKNLHPETEISLMVRKGNESLYVQHPSLNHLLVWEKKKKWPSFFQNLKWVRKQKFDAVFCLQRHFTMAAFTLFSGGKRKFGFSESPLSFCFHQTVPHAMGNGKHEVERNTELAKLFFPDIKIHMPKLHPSAQDFAKVKPFQNTPYVCMAPSSVWKTKQLPPQKWVELIGKQKTKIYLLGAPSDKDMLNQLVGQCSSSANIQNLAGELTLMQSAALMKGAAMNFVNDSGPLHLCSAVDAPVASFFCSTIPAFGFGPLSNTRFVFESKELLSCRPCGLHGKTACPEKHFACGNSIDIDEVIKTIENSKTA